VKYNDEYSWQLQSSKQNEKEMMTLAWRLKELNELDQIGRNFVGSIKVLITKIDRRGTP